jgi:hypothetical protein
MANGTKLKSFLGQVFHFKLGSFIVMEDAHGAKA